jgi:hypothetical protein
VSLFHSQQRNSWPVRALMIAEHGLDRGNGRREAVGSVAADRCDGLGCVAASLGPDADGVPLDVGRILSEGLADTFQPSPGRRTKLVTRAAASCPARPAGSAAISGRAAMLTRVSSSWS